MSNPLGNLAKEGIERLSKSKMVGKKIFQIFGHREIKPTHNTHLGWPYLRGDSIYSTKMKISECMFH